MKLTILCDNSVEPRPGLLGEHGFACHISSAGKQYLFDTGSGLGLIKNAKTLGIALDEIDAVLLSHGHWDHCNGLLPLLQVSRKNRLQIYTHPDIFAERYAIRDDIQRKIGPEFSLQDLQEYADVHLSKEALELPGGVTFSGQVPQKHKQKPEAGLFVQNGGQLQQDNLPDDQSLYLQTEKGLTILCGCAHAGVRNIITHALELQKTNKLFGLIGGLHLVFSEAEGQDELAVDLEKFDIQLIALSHCTGPRAVSQLMSRFGEKVSYAAAGREIEL